MVDIRHIRLDTQPDDLVQLARQFATLDSERRALEERVKAIKDECQAIEARLVLAFENHDISGPITLRDLSLSVYVHTSRYASVNPEQAEHIQAVFESNGLGYMVKPSVNGQTLSAWIREVEDAGGAIPAEIEACIRRATLYRIRTRKATR